MSKFRKLKQYTAESVMKAFKDGIHVAKYRTITTGTEFLIAFFFVKDYVLP